MQIASQLYGDDDDDEFEGNIAQKPKSMAWPLTHLTDRRSVAVTTQAQYLFFTTGESRLACARKVVTRIADRLG